MLVGCTGEQQGRARQKIYPMAGVSRSSSNLPARFSEMLAAPRIPQHAQTDLRILLPQPEAESDKATVREPTAGRVPYISVIQQVCNPTPRVLSRVLQAYARRVIKV
jgi:hypothetical protein